MAISPRVVWMEIGDVLAEHSKPITFWRKLMRHAANVEKLSIIGTFLNSENVAIETFLDYTNEARVDMFSK